jgi:hypothetical protein
MGPFRESRTWVLNQQTMKKGVFVAPTNGNVDNRNSDFTIKHMDFTIFYHPQMRVKHEQIGV